MKSLITSLVMVFLLAFVASAQETTPQPDSQATPEPATHTSLQPLRVWADGASYVYFNDSTHVPDPAKSYVEVYVGLARKDVQFEEVQGFYEGRVYLYLEIMDKSGNVVDSLGKWRPIEVKYLEDAYKENIRIFDVLPCLLAPGDYSMRLTAVDGISKRTGIATFDMTVKQFDPVNLDLSNIELAYLINPVEQDSIKSPLVKSGRQVVPNPNRYVSNEDSLLYYYAEVYNLVKRESGNDDFEVSATILDSYGYEIREYPPVRDKKPGTTAVITEGLPLKGLPGGNYDLNIKVEDKTTGRKVTADKKFMLIYAFDQLTPTMSSPDSFTVDDAKLMSQVIRYITSKEEKDTYEGLNLEGKRKWLQAFWDRKNPNPGAKVNSYKNEIFRRFMYANFYYSNSLLKRNDGWSSDRGRVYITYGPPDQVDQHPSSMGQQPYEKWLYFRLPDQSGGNYFVFLDDTGYGNYRLVTSTVKGEISNPQYDNLLNDELSQ